MRIASLVPSLTELLVALGLDAQLVARTGYCIHPEGALRDVPLIILTSKSSPIDLIRGALAGCNSYLVKPVSLKALRETVIKNLRRSSRFDIALGPVKPANGTQSFA